MTIAVFKTVSDVVKENFTGKCKVGNETSIRHYFEGKLHRVDGPAIEWNDGSKHWCIDGKIHRVDGPAVEYAGGKKSWWIDDKLHRTDGPAIEYMDGTKAWYQNGTLHRVDGPAIESANGDKIWYLNGKYHRTDGPAIEGYNGTQYWYVDGKELTKEKFNKMYGVKIAKFESISKIPYNFNGICELPGSIRHYKEGLLHNENGPAILRGHKKDSENQSKEWFFVGDRHRVDGPAVEYSNGSKEWWLKGKKHRVDGPAIEYHSHKEWYENGLHHRVDGPAIEDAAGHKEWWLNGLRHRIDGPAIENLAGYKEWFIEGKEYSEEEFNKKILEMNIKEFDTILDIPIAFTGSCRIVHNNEIRHYKNGELHSENEPAVVGDTGYKKWYQYGKLHRVDGPAIEYSNGDKGWWLNGEIHRINGPAIECVSGRKEWYIEGIEYSEQDFNEKLSGMMHKFQNISDVPANFTGVCRVLFIDDLCHFKDGEFHNENGPAVESRNGNKEWFVNDKRHRTDGPAIERSSGSKEWYQNGVLHRVDGPAIEYADGHKEWVVDGKYHRENGPAIEYADGSKKWLMNGELHRVDGPAIEYANGTKFYWIKGENYSEKEFNEKISEMNIPEFDHEYDVPKDFTGVCKVVLITATIHFKNGKRHNDNGPAYQNWNGDKSWWINGKIHRVDGPAVEFNNGYKCWYFDGKKHRTDGPATEYSNGDKEWWINGINYSSEEFNEKIAIMNIKSEKNSENIKEVEYEKEAQDCKFTGPIKITSIPAIVYLKEGVRHRQDGPAFEGNGIKTWFLDDKLHRADGPAVENENTQRYEYWFNNVLYSKVDFENIPDVKKLSEKNTITKKDEEMKTLKENKNFIIKCAKDAKYRVAGEQLSLAVRAAIVKILSGGESEYIQNAEMIMSTDFGKALVQGGVSLIMHQLPTDNAHVQALTYELMVASVATGEGAILTAAFSSLNDFVKGQITSIKDDTLTSARVDANEDMEEETSSESKSKLTS